MAVRFMGAKRLTLFYLSLLVRGVMMTKWGVK